MSKKRKRNEEPRTHSGLDTEPVLDTVRKPDAGRLPSCGTKIGQRPCLIEIPILKHRARNGYLKWLGVGDIHYPHHDPVAVQLVTRFIRLWKPDYLFFMGDVFDMLPISHHEYSPSSLNLRKIEGLRLIEDYRQGWESVMKPMTESARKAYKVWVDGNHEAWAEKLTGRIPGLEGMIDPYSVLGLHRTFDLYAPQGSILRLGRLSLTHGDSLVRGSKYVAARAVERFSSSIVMWHHHTVQVYTRETLHNMGFQTGISVGCLANLHPHYKPTPIHSWVHGFAYGLIFVADGSFSVHVPIIYDGRLYADRYVITHPPS